MNVLKLLSDRIVLEPELIILVLEKLNLHISLMHRLIQLISAPELVFRFLLHFLNFLGILFSIFGVTWLMNSFSLLACS